VHGPLLLEFTEGVEALARAIAEVVPGARRIGFDEITSPMLACCRACCPRPSSPTATLATGAARIVKTARRDRMPALLAAHQRGRDVRRRGGVASRRASERAVGHFLRGVFEQGASSSIIDPIWSLTPLSVAAGTYTANADVGFPLASSDRFLREGDLVMCDTGIT